jgi:hypothetical protein
VCDVPLRSAAAAAAAIIILQRAACTLRPAARVRVCPLLLLLLSADRAFHETRRLYRKHYVVSLVCLKPLLQGRVGDKDAAALQ